MVLKTARLDEVTGGVGMGEKGSLGHSLAEWAEEENLGQRSINYISALIPIALTVTSGWPVMCHVIYIHSLI